MKFPWWFMWPAHDELLDEPVSVPADAPVLRLRVWRSPHRFWWWRVIGPDGALDSGTARSWAEALALGTAALEVASLAGSTP